MVIALICKHRGDRFYGKNFYRTGGRMGMGMCEVKVKRLERSRRLAVPAQTCQGTNIDSIGSGIYPNGRKRAGRQKGSPLRHHNLMLMRMRGIEPPRCHHHRLLRPARLPVPPHPQGITKFTEVGEWCQASRPAPLRPAVKRAKTSPAWWQRLRTRRCRSRFHSGAGNPWGKFRRRSSVWLRVNLRDCYSCPQVLES